MKVALGNDIPGKNAELFLDSFGVICIQKNAVIIMGCLEGTCDKKNSPILAPLHGHSDHDFSL